MFGPGSAAETFSYAQWCCIQAFQRGVTHGKWCLRVDISEYVQTCSNVLQQGSEKLTQSENDSSNVLDIYIL